jgi:hypothetical protein
LISTYKTKRKKRKVGAYRSAIPEADNAPLTLFIICSSSGFVCSESSSSSLDDVSCCESLSSLLSSSSVPDELEVSSLLLLLLSLSSIEGDSSSLPEGSKAGVVVGVDVLSCTGIWLQILFWLIQIYVIFFR